MKRTMNSEKSRKKGAAKSKVGRPRISKSERISIGRFLQYKITAADSSAAMLASLYEDIYRKKGLNGGKRSISSRTISYILQGEKGSWPSIRAISIALGYDNLEAFLTDCALYDVPPTEDSAIKSAVPSSKATNRPLDVLLEDARHRVISDPDVIRLTSLFQNTSRLKMDDAYVELAMTHPMHGKPAPDTLVAYRTEREKHDQAAKNLTANRMSPQHALDKSTNATLILGDPGSGKSSLMRRIAINIAQGSWTHYDIALFITATDFAYREDKSLNLTQFAWSQVYQSTSEAEHTDLTDSEQYLLRESSKFIVLVDGLDEIAGDLKAVKAVYEGLQYLKTPWIATSRPAGLMRRPETACYRLADLDRFAIEGLIEKWSKVTFGETWEDIAESLIVEIGKSRALVTMASNPFLLTALIYLKSSRPHDPLPQTRIKIYEMLVDNIAGEAQRAKNSGVLTDAVQASLAEFSYGLFQSDTGPRQVFEGAQWADFQRGQTIRFDLTEHVLGARLVTEENKLCRRYHFIHLSLQEHFVARHMVEKEIETVIQYRFSPEWRNAFIAYGGLLYEKNEIKTFKKLVAILWNDRDRAGQQVILLAQIFAAAGVTNTERFIDMDLKHALYETHFDQDTIIDSSGMRALAELAPEWLYNTKVKEINEDYVPTDFVDGDEWHSGSELSFIGEQEFSPFHTLATTKIKAAYQYLKSTFHGVSQERALEAAPGFSRVSTYRDRQDILEIGLAVNVDSEQFFRCYTFFDCLQHAEGVPVFMRCLTGPWWDDETKRQQALQSIWLAGGDKAYAAMMTCAEHLKLDYESGKRDLESYAEDILKFTAYLGGERSRAVFEFIETHTLIKNSILSYRFNAGIVEPSEVKARMGTQDGQKKTICALREAAENSFSASYSILSKVANVSPEVFDERLEDFIAIETHRPRSQNFQSLCPQIYESCIRRMRTKNSEDISGIMEAALRVFAAKAYFRAAPIAHWVLQYLKKDSEAVGAAAEFLGHASFGSNDKALLDVLEVILFDPKIDARQDILHSIGRISPERINLLRGHNLGADTVKMLASDHDILLFEDYWTDADGRQHYFDFKPDKFLYFFFTKKEDDEEYLGLLDTIKTITSKHHFDWYDFFEKSEGRPESYSGILFISPNQDDSEAQNFFETFVASTSADPKYKSFFELPHSSIHLDEIQVSLEKKILSLITQVCAASNTKP